MQVNKNIPEFDHEHWQVDPEDVRAPEGRKKTNSLFLETISTPQLKKYGAIYTLAENPQYDSYWDRWLPSAKRIYVLSNNEYEAALKLVSSIEHWNRLVANEWFVEGVPKDYRWTSLNQWREEQQQRKIAAVEGELMEKALSGNVQAIKTLLGMYKDDGRGRPSKAEVDGELKKQTRNKQDYEEDANRVLELVDRGSK